MAFNYQQMVIWIMLFIGLVLVPSYSFLAYTESPLSPLSHSSSSHHPNLKYLILKKAGKKVPPPSPLVTPFDYWKLAETWSTVFTIHGL